MRLAYPYPEHLGHSPTRLLQVAATIKALLEEGVKVHFLVGAYPGLDQRLAELGLAGHENLAVERLPMLQPGPGRRWRVSWHGLFNHAAAFRIGELGRRELLAVLVRHLKLAEYILRRFKPGLPLIYEAHEIFAQSAAESGMKGAKLAKLAARESKVLSKAARVVAISKPLAGELAKRPEVKHPVAVAPSGVDESFFSLPAGGRDPGLVAYCGGLSEWKGVDLALRALAQSQNVRLETLGGSPDGADWRRLQALARELDLGQRLKMRPRAGRDQVAELLGRAGIALWPGTAGRRIAAEFTSPLKLFEYLAAGCAVAAPDLPAANTVLSHGQNAWLFQADQPQELARALDHMAGDPELAARLAANGRELARGYTWRSRARVLMRVMEEVLR